MTDRAGQVESRSRLLMLASEFPPGPGGIGTHAHQLVVGLRRRGWEVRVLTNQDYASDGEVMAFNAAQAFEIVRLRRVAGPAVEAIYRGLALARNLRAFRPNVLVASGSRSVMVAAARGAGRAIPLVAIGHGTEFGGGSGWQSKAVRWAFRRAAAVVSVSEFTRAQMLR
ncbi:MAG TPA: glycosyltransferase, partial [Thermoanaerobaculia bacterium]|nr:glycosyltransferase [Thermoanaerobaculia bacterium]